MKLYRYVIHDGDATSVAPDVERIVVIGFRARLKSRLLVNAKTACRHLNISATPNKMGIIALLFRKNRLVLPTRHTSSSCMENIVESLGLNILPLTPAIAALAESGIVAHGDPADRLIAATALVHQAPLITADQKLPYHTWPSL